jgi:putative toxin-antitoxin system antitoxin component (TIGR02293 family)
MKESDRLYNLIETVSRATCLFEGDRRAAVEWMSKKAPGLGDKRPSDMLDSHANTQAVLEVITRLEYGVYS